MKQILAALLVAAMTFNVMAAETNSLAIFKDKILPILETKCIDCHNSKDKKKGGLELDSGEGLRRGGSSGRVVIPHEPEKSLLYRAVAHSSPDLTMPPKETLTPEQVASIKEWILLGASDDRQIKKVDFKSHWAFLPLSSPAVPESKADNVVDKFVYSELSKRGILPAQRADKRDLIRRLYFDLTGLPPTYEQVELFKNDESPNAWERVVDAVLASPHYGERWARYWMDLARYSDYKGGNNNRLTDKNVYAWTYRDYLIQSFNDDKPYNQFMVEQLAADLTSTNLNPSLAALGFLSLGKADNDNNNRVDEKINTISRTFIGLSVGCARCHYHKFDPIAQEDYYGWHGILKGLSEPREYPVIKNTSSMPEYAAYLAEKTKLEAGVEAYKVKEFAKWSAYFQKHSPDYFRAAFYNEYLSREIRRDYARTNRIEGIQMSQRVLQSWIKETASKNSPFWLPYQKLSPLTDKTEFAAALQSLQSDPKADANVITNLSRLKLTNGLGVFFYYEGLFQKALTFSTNRSTGSTNAGVSPIYAAQDILTKSSGPSLIGSVEDFSNYLPNQQQNTYQNGVRDLTEKIYQHEWDSVATPPRAQVMIDSGSSDSKLLIKGNAGKPGDLAPRRALVFFNQNVYTNSKARLDFARDLVSMPMTSRVIVNRLWMSHFNQGFVTTPDDIGVNAEKPDLVLLMDYLSKDLVDNGWNLKRTHKTILMSQTYQQSCVNFR